MGMCVGNMLGIWVPQGMLLLDHSLLTAGFFCHVDEWEFNPSHGRRWWHFLAHFCTLLIYFFVFWNHLWTPEIPKLSRNIFHLAYSMYRATSGVNPSSHLGVQTSPCGTSVQFSWQFGMPSLDVSGCSQWHVALSHRSIQKLVRQFVVIQTHNILDITKSKV